MIKVVIFFVEFTNKYEYNNRYNLYFRIIYIYICFLIFILIFVYTFKSSTYKLLNNDHIGSYDIFALIPVFARLKNYIIHYSDIVAI